ncbi:MAG: hypothetical protein KDK62_04520 [Chlamydiia bacterium]|nr:hypothetical protein [Chlamydiia bacterium]
MRTLFFGLLSCFIALYGNIFDYAGPLQIRGLSEYKEKDYQGDTVVELYDGSLWKVHPDHKEIALAWEPFDEVHVQLRKSIYWFSRPHKFRLHNRTKGESVKVMILDYGFSPLLVFSTSKPFATCWDEVPIYALDNEGQEIIVGYKLILKGWKQVLELTDGSTVEIRDNFENFKEGTEIFVGIDERWDYQGPFFITGKKEQAKWTPAYLLERDEK